MSVFKFFLWTVVVCVVCGYGALTCAAASGPDTVSSLERLYQQRTGQNLSLFGHDFFSSPPLSPSSLGTLPDDFILGVGDRLNIHFRGEGGSLKSYIVDSQGKVLVDRLRPLLAAGISLGKFRETLEAEVAASIPMAEVFVSLSEVHRVGVHVVGEVSQPGRVDVSALNTVFDVLLASGGVKNTGSLRHIRLVRQGEARPVDLYDVYFQGTSSADTRIQNGDRLIVPSIGPTFAVTGDVKRSAIFEMPVAGSLSIKDALSFAGGTVHPTAARITRLRFDSEGQESAQSVAADSTDSLQDGDILVVSPQKNVRTGTVFLDGHVKHPGPRSLDQATVLSRLLTLDDVQSDPYLPFGIIETTDPASARRRFDAVNLQSIFSGLGERSLIDEDKVLILSAQDIAFLASERVLLALQGKTLSETISASDSCAGIQVLAQAMTADPEKRLLKNPAVQAAAQLTPVQLPCPPIFDRYPDLLRFVIDHAVAVRDGEDRPGLYPVISPAATLPPPSAVSLTYAPKTSPKIPTPSALAEQIARVLGSDPIHMGMAEELASSDQRRGGSYVELSGAVLSPGTRSLKAAPTVKKLLQDTKPRADIYPFFAVVERFNASSLSRASFVFSPASVLSKRTDRRLENRDRVRVFTRDEIHLLVRSLQPEFDKPTELPSDLEPYQSLVREHRVMVHGGVHHPGAYPMGEGAILKDALEAAGGLISNANARQIEVSFNIPSSPHKDSLSVRRKILDISHADAENTPLKGSDAVHVATLFSDQEEYAVAIKGEVRFPGQYSIRRGETLSSLLARAGGLTDQAFPQGAVFTRQSIRLQEQEGYARAAQELDRSLAALALKDKNQPSAEGMAMARQLAQDLRQTKPVGRMMVEADPAALTANPDVDVVLEPFDSLVIPRRPLTVAVSGEVLSPSALQFRPGKSAEDYIREAGGLTRYADDSRIFVLLPNGSSQPLSLSAWNFKSSMITPGSTIIVPRDPKPYDFLDFAESVGGLLGQLAITAASLAVIATAD